MKIEEQNGKKIIILDNEETVMVSSSGSDVVEITNEQNSLKLFNYIEKGKIITKKEEIIEKCDKMVDMFKKIIYDFSEKSKSKAYVDLAIWMELSFTTCFNNFDKRMSKGIDLDLTTFSETFRKGPHVSIYNSNKDIFNYIFAKLSYFYVSTFYQGDEININIKERNILHSSSNVGTTIMAFDNVDNDIVYILRIIITDHNCGKNSLWLIDSLRDKIEDQYVDENFEESFKNTLDIYNEVLDNHSRSK